MNLDQVRLFQRIVELGSLAAAAREAAMSPSTVSERLASLEASLGVALLNRTTRSISLTDAGRTLWEGADSLLEDASMLESRIRRGVRSLSGPIRISAPSDIGRGFVSAQIDRFQQTYPEVRFEVHLSDGYIDFVGQGFDLALRYGAATDSSLRAMPLGEWSRIICASPNYLSRHGAPETPDDLSEHDCLLMRFGDFLDNQWRFRVGSKRRTIVVSGVRIANDGGLVRKWCVEGAGIALKSELDIATDLEAGRLAPLLTAFSANTRSLQMLFPPHRRQPKRVRAFADYLTEALGKAARS
ncbi:MAG: LysR family transcriptional regulator [Pseudomonadota bacterium]